LLLFTNVNGFKITNILCRNQRWWALTFIYYRNGYLGNIDFMSSDVAVDENGNEYHGLKRNKYNEVLIKNSDGIDLRQGCNNIVIENITGFTEDDSIALTGLNGKLEQEFKVEGLSSDISNIQITNIRTTAFCTNVRLLNQDGIKLHNVNIDGVYDTSFNSPYIDKGLYTVRIGDTHLYGKRHSTANETYDITIKNVSGSGEHVICLAGAITNLTMLNVTAQNGANLLMDNRIK
jgi:hypothetical protein